MHDRLRFLSAVTTLRRHVHHLFKSLFTMVDPREGVRPTDNSSSFLGCSACDGDTLGDSKSIKQCASLGLSQHCSSEYSTCPSGVYSGLSDVLVLEYEEGFSSSSPLSSSCCSTCSSLLESTSSSDSIYSDSPSYVEPSTLSLSQGNKSVTCPYQLTETKRREIIVWAKQVIPTEHPVKDDYRMVVYHPHPRRPRVTDSTSRTRR